MVRAGAEEMAKAAGAPLMAQIPIEPELAKLCDKGEIERYSNELVTKLGESLAKIVPARVEQEVRKE